MKKLNRWSDKHEDGTVTFDQNYLGQIDDLKHKADCGTMKSMDSVITGIFLPHMNSKCYLLFSGTYDYICPYPLSLKYFEKLDAPLKGFYTFDNSAHSPLWKEPDQAIKILTEDILQGNNALYDFTI